MSSSTNDGKDEADLASLFETAADFFALFSLTSIVAVLVYSAATVTGGATRTPSVEPGPAYGAAEVSNTLYLVVRQSGGPPRVEIRFRTSMVTRVNIRLAHGNARTRSTGEVVNAVGKVLSGQHPKEIDCLVEDPPTDELLGYTWELQDRLENAGIPCSLVGKLR